MLYPGLYEQVINNALNRELSEVPETRKSTAPIDTAEASKVLAQYLTDVVQKGLENVQDNGGGIEAQIQLANQIVTTIQNTTQEADFAALGVDVKLTLDDIRMSIVDSVENGETREALELLSEARFRIFDALVEMPGFAFLGIGRPESSGCYCKVNSYLKEVIGILANSFDYVVIDGEAGIEQIQRRVMDKVTHLILVTDQSKKGCQVISTIKSVADDLIVYDKIVAIINRMTNPELAGLITIPGVEIAAFIPADSAFAANDIKGKSVLELPEDSLMLNGVKEALQKIEIL